MKFLVIPVIEVYDIQKEYCKELAKRVGEYDFVVIFVDPWNHNTSYRNITEYLIRSIRAKHENTYTIGESTCRLSCAINTIKPIRINNMYNVILIPYYTTKPLGEIINTVVRKKNLDVTHTIAISMGKLNGYPCISWNGTVNGPSPIVPTISGYSSNLYKNEGNIHWTGPSGIIGNCFHYTSEGLYRSYINPYPVIDPNKNVINELKKLHKQLKR